MASYHLLFNPKASSGHGAEGAARLVERLNTAVTLTDVTTIPDMGDFMATLSPQDRLIITGGDGTLNRFINRILKVDPHREVYYYAAGTGNDFLRDVGRTVDGDPFLLTPYFQNLPEVEVGGKRMRFINGVGTGLDGFVCAQMEKKWKTTGKKGNYTAMALKGLLRTYHPASATVTVDGVTREYDHVWLAPTMFGRYLGGGIPLAPDQSRINPAGTVSCMVFTVPTRGETLVAFPQVLAGKHMKLTQYCKVVEGHRVEVTFDRPMDMQIDGDVVAGVTSYKVRSAMAMAEDAALMR